MLQNRLGDFIIHMKNNNLFWSYLLYMPAPPVNDIAPPQHLHSKYSGAAPDVD